MQVRVWPLAIAAAVALVSQTAISVPDYGVLTADCGAICDLSGRTTGTANASSFEAPLCVRHALGCRESDRIACVDDPTGNYQCINPAAGVEWMIGFSSRSDVLQGYVHPYYENDDMDGATIEGPVNPLQLDPDSLTSLDGLALPSNVVNLYVDL